MGQIEGSVALQQQVALIKPNVHIFGHTHWDISTTVGGVRYVQKPLGYPKERADPGNTGELKRLYISTHKNGEGADLTQWAESPPLALIWSEMILASAESRCAVCV